MIKELRAEEENLTLSDMYDSVLNRSGYLKALEDIGYTVRTGIGRSDYKIDIGVVNPDDPGTYLMGIMCGSESGFELTNARDRNIVQPSVLAGLGWKIVNVHILDWLDNDRKVLEYLNGEIGKALAAYREGEPVQQEEAPKKRELTFEKEESTESEDSHVYVPFVPEVIGDQAYFNDMSSTSQIKRIIEAAVEWEAPVSREVLLHYVLAAFGMKRSARAEQRFSEIFDGMDLKTTQRKDSVFVWRADQEPSEYGDFRGPAEDGSNKVFYNVKRVFDVSQTNSNRRQPAQSVNRNPKDALIAMLDTAPVEVETVDSFMYSDTIAEYNNDAGKLSVRRGVNDEVKLFQSVALELAFAELSVNSKSYDRRELTFAAVCTANMLCKKFGVPAERFKITELPPSWQEKDVKAVRAELSKIRQATSGICSRVNEELYRQRQEKTPEREPRSGGRDR